MTPDDWKLLIEGIKTILDPLSAASWPIAFFATAIVFKKPISELLQRIKNLRGWGAEADLDSVPIKDQRADRTLGVASDKLALPAPNEPQNAQLAVKPPQDAVYEQVENDLGRRLNELFPNDQDAQLRWALRAYSVAEVERYHEANFRIIFGTQLSLLNFANQRTTFDADEADQFYSAFRETDVYREIRHKPDFDQWLKFIISIKYIDEIGHNNYMITPLGRSFLNWLIARGVGQFRPG